MNHLVAKLTLAGLLVLACFATAQPPPRMHRITEKGELEKRPATEKPPAANEVSIRIEGEDRVITSNGIPNHATGQFPNRGNPNRIAPQMHEFRVPANPKVADRVTPMHGMFGVAINGVPFDPGAGEFYDGAHGWQYEPLSGAIDLGIDVSHAHVQPGGKYHYHGLPTGLLDSVKIDASKHSPLIGWAADGFPIYAVYGYSDPKDANSTIQKLTSSYQLKQGDRPGGDHPGGAYDGTFVADYEYVQGSGSLDECNGRETITPDFPDGTYAYFMTENWPVVPRVYRGTPSRDLMHGPGAGGPSLAGGPPGRGRPGMAGGEREPRGFGRGGAERGGQPSGRGPGRVGPGPEGPGQGGPPHGQGGPRFGGGPPRPGVILPDFVQQSLNLSEDQTNRLDELQEKVDSELAKILTDEQRRQLENHRPPGPSGDQRQRGGNGRPQRPSR